MTTGLPITLDPASECRTDQQRALWAERMLDAIDAPVSLEKESPTKEFGALYETALRQHVAACKYCRETLQALSATDSHLSHHFAESGHAPALDFDAKLMARIEASEVESRATRRQRELHDYQNQLAHIQHSWRQFMGRSLSTIVGVLATLLVAVLSFGSSLVGAKVEAMHAFSDEASRLAVLIDKVGPSLLPVAAIFFSVAVAVLALWLTQRSDRQLR